MGALTVSINNVAVQVIEGSFQETDSISSVSTVLFKVRDDSGLNHYTKGMPVSITDSITGLTFTGFVAQAIEDRVSPNTLIITDIGVRDNHYLAEKRTYDGVEFTNVLAGVILCQLLNTLSQEGITAKYASRLDSTTSDFNAGTLSSVVGAATVGDGDLELSLAGTTFTKTETTTTDFNGGTLTNVVATNNQLQLASTQAVKLVGTAAANLNSDLYSYIEIWNGSVSFASGDYLQYDVWISSTSPNITGGIDLVASDGYTLRGSPALDQNQISPHPKTDLKGFADDQWYTRTIGIPTQMVGKTLAYATIALEGDTNGTYTVYARHIKLFNSSNAVKATIYDSGSLNTNVQLGNVGYYNVKASTATVYETNGNRVSSAYTGLANPSIAQSSLIYWNQTTPVQLASKQSTTYAPPILIEITWDGGATWLTCANGGSIPNLLAGMGLSGKSIQVRETISVAGPSPELTPALQDLTIQVFPSYAAAAKTDVQDSDSIASGLGTGTLTNISNIASIGNQISGWKRNWDNGDLSNQTLYGDATSVPAQSIWYKALQLRIGTGFDVRSRLDFAGQWQDFVCEFDTQFPDTDSANYGLVYRTTGWQNNNDTYAYSAFLSNAGVAIGKGTNSSTGTGSFTSLGSASITFTAGNWYHVKVVVSGTSHKLYVDDVLYVNITDATYTATGYLGLRHYYNGASSRHSGYFDNFGVMTSAFSGTRVHPSLSLNACAVVTNSIIFWAADVPANTSLLIEASINGGSTYTACTNGAVIPGITPGSNMTGVSLLIRETYTTNNADYTPTLTGITALVVGNYSASGNRISPALSLANVGRLGGSVIAWNSNLPSGCTLGVDTRIDAGSWTDQSTQNGQAVAGLTGQSAPWLDSFNGSSSTQGNGVTIGLNPGTGNPGSPYAFWTQLFADMQALGMTWLRFQLSWDSIELTQGNYSWTVLDDAVSHCNAAGIKIWYTIRGAPSWALDPANGGQLTCSDGWYIMSPSKTAGFATVLMQRYYPGSPHGHLDALGFNEDFNIHNTSTSDTLTLNQTLTSGVPVTSFTINAAGFAPMVGTKLYFGSYASADVATVSTNVANGATTVQVSSFTPASTYTAGTSIKIAYVPATSSIYDMYDPGSGGRTTSNPKSQASRNPVYAAAVFNAVAPAIRALNSSILIGMPCTWWLQPINAPTFPGSTVSNMTAFVTQLLVSCAAHIDANTFMDGHFYTNAVDPTVGNGQTSTIAQWVADFQNAANANGFPTLPLCVSELGWQANQSATSSTTIAAGTRTITLDVTRGAANGITCLIDTVGSGVQETVTITAKTSTSITAVFANAHTQPFPVIIQLDCAATGADGQDERYNEVLTAIAPGGARGNKAFPFTLDETQSLSAGSGSSLVLWNGTGYSQQPAYSTVQTYNTGLLPDFASYTQTNYGGGTNATWTWDTINSRIIGTGGTRGVLQYTAFSFADGYVLADMDYAESDAGIVMRMADTSHLYFIKVNDASSGIAPNTIKLFVKNGSGAATQVGSTGTINFIRGTYHRIKFDLQGTAFTISFDGQVVISATDATLSAAGLAGLLDGVKIQCYQLYIQPYGADVSSHTVQTRLRLATTLPTATPQVLDVTIAAFGNTIQAGAVIPQTAFYHQYMDKNIDFLAKASNYWWYFDKNKIASFMSMTGLPAPWIASDGGSPVTGLPAGDFMDANITVEDSSDLYRNRQIIDNVLAPVTINENRIGDGVTTSWTFGNQWAGPPTITITNNNGVQTVATVGVKNVDTGKQFYYAVGDPTITEDSSGPVYNASFTLNFTGPGQYLTYSIANNLVEQAALATIEGGVTTGIVTIVEDGTGLTKAQGDVLAQARINQYSVRGRLLKATTRRSGLTPGMLLNVFLPAHNIFDQLFLIRQITTTLTTEGPTGAMVQQGWYAIEAISGPDVGDWTKLYQRT